MNNAAPQRLSVLLVRNRDGLCRDCLIHMTDASPEEVDLALADLRRMVLMASEERTCLGCHRTATVVRFATAE
jgi:hypothetical protein